MLFAGFNQKLFDDPSFKEDSVREVVIAPMLRKLGYQPSGEQSVVRSKSLQHPFIYVGTRRHPVTIIPDYTLYFRGQAVLIVDAKAPGESVTSRPNVQQAYSYAIHPEVKAKHFALCNGREFALYTVDSASPVLLLPFSEYESRWDALEKYLLPKYLLQPELRLMKPDFGHRVAQLGLERGSPIIMIGARFGMVARLDQGLYTASVNTEFSGEDHCVSFDFTSDKLAPIVSGLPEELSEQFLGALSRQPFQACADLVIEVDIKTHLGDTVTVEHESFVPLIIDEVFGSRFVPDPPEGGNDIPSHVFRLSKAFKIVNRPSSKDEEPAPDA